MLINMMKGKLHSATVTHADLDYEGSISIDVDLAAKAGFLTNEKVDIYNITTGARFSTYVIEAPSGSKEIGLNGAAARMVMKNDKIIIVAYALMEEAEAKSFQPRIVCLGEDNSVK